MIPPLYPVTYSYEHMSKVGEGFYQQFDSPYEVRGTTSSKSMKA